MYSSLNAVEYGKQRDITEEFIDKMVRSRGTKQRKRFTN